MKILIIGSSGMAGHTIMLFLKEQGHMVYSISRSFNPLCDGIICDVTNTILLKKYITESNFDIIINCVGILNQICDEKISEAIFVNSYIPHFISEIIKGSKTKLILLSTDCVFSGRKGGYNEDDLPDGETNYDRSKALGEINDSNNLTFRNSIIGPDINKNGIGLFNWFMKQEGAIWGYSNVMWNGVTTLVLAQAIERAINENLTGIYHLVNEETISKLNLLRLFNKYMKADSLNIQEKNDIISNKSLVNNRRDFSYIVPDYEHMIADMKDWIAKHHKLYPHYRLIVND